VTDGKGLRLKLRLPIASGGWRWCVYLLELAVDGHGLGVGPQHVVGHDVRLRRTVTRLALAAVRATSIQTRGGRKGVSE
jgi:hypothetical protein